MIDLTKYALRPARILLPGEGVDLAKWAVVACDQFTSQSEYWRAVERIVGQSPSTINMIYPECDLHQGDGRIESIAKHMRAYKRDVLTRAFEGFSLVCRQTQTGKRLGLVGAVDLEKYDYEAGAKSLIRPTEGTILSRIPPRVKIRRGAPLETTHVMLLVDDPGRTLIEPLYEARGQLEPLYDFDLMQGGGRIQGWAVEGDARFAQIGRALEGLYGRCGGLLYAVGDGNHSLATARACWLEIKKTLSSAAQASHPARWALVEIGNLHDDSLIFEPIHRAVFGADDAAITHDFVLWCRAEGIGVVACGEEAAQLYLLDAPVKLENARGQMPLLLLQRFLDEWLSAHPAASIDYIHGAEALAALGARGAACFRLRAMDKHDLFEAVRKNGALPRKCFSMGEATDKRYYLECRSLED